MWDNRIFICLSIKKKSEQFEKFKEFKSHYELSTSNKIKEFRTDNGSEYMSNEFKDYLKEPGIKHNTSVAYCPQSNGKAERLNRTLIEKARCMLITANVHISCCNSYSKLLEKFITIFSFEWKITI